MIKRSGQLVIVAGGLGTRLRPITKNLPKVLVPVNEIPFLAYLVWNAANNGVNRVVVLTGYLSDLVQDFCDIFNSNSPLRHHIHLDCQSSSPALGSGGRLNEALDDLEPSFLLQYCDNWVPTAFSKICTSGRTACSVVCFDNSSGGGEYDFRGNVLTDVKGKIIRYSQDKSELYGLTDTGLMRVNKELICESLRGLSNSVRRDLMVSDIVFRNDLVESGMIEAYIETDRYYWITDPESLREFSNFAMFSDLTRRVRRAVYG